MSAAQLSVKVGYRMIPSEVNTLLGVKGYQRMVSVLTWIRCLGHSDKSREFPHPRTLEPCKTPANEVLYVATAEHLGAECPWFFGESQLGMGALGNWKGSIKLLKPDQEAILLLKAERLVWEVTHPIILQMGIREVTIDPANHLLIQSLDPKGGLSFVPYDCVYEGNDAATCLFTGLVYRTNFERDREIVRKLIPPEFLVL